MTTCWGFGVKAEAIFGILKKKSCHINLCWCFWTPCELYKLMTSFLFFIIPFIIIITIVIVIVTNVILSVLKIYLLVS